MKKTALITLTIFALILTACSAAPSTTTQADSANPSQTLPETTQLIIGTFKLESTEQAITTEQAKTLLPLWQVYNDLLASDSAAQEEKDALVEQIQETLTTEQTQAIAAMNLTPQDMFTVMQEQNIEFGNGAQRPQNGGNTQNNTSGGLPAGGPPDGGFPGGGPGGGGFGDGGQGLTPDQIATAQALRSENGGAGFGGLTNTPAPLIEALIQFLQKKSGA